jgi:hypothetical protein
MRSRAKEAQMADSDRWSIKRFLAQGNAVRLDLTPKDHVLGKVEAVNKRGIPLTTTNGPDGAENRSFYPWHVVHHVTLDAS